MSQGVRTVVRDALEPWWAEVEEGRTTLLVALSGGLDSCVLLHAVRFGLSARVRAAHFDHGMRPCSAADAAWVRGLCRAWGVELTSGEWTRPPPQVGGPADGEGSGWDGDDSEREGEGSGPSEAEARTARYAFLHETRRACAPALLLTAHHADDQAETVLFRVLRGTGIDGLAGIPAVREPAIVRPLLSLWREELEAYARRHRVPWREDPTNRDAGYARNLLRHRLLPLAEDAAPGARRALVRLAGIARQDGDAWSRAMEIVVGELDVKDLVDPSGARVVSVDRGAFLGLGSPLGARALRHLVRDRLGAAPPDAAGTRRVLDFIHSAQSGRRVELGDGVEIVLALERLQLHGPAPAGEVEAHPLPGASDQPDGADLPDAHDLPEVLDLPDLSLAEDGAVGTASIRGGEAQIRIGGARYRVRWRAGGPGTTGEEGAASSRRVPPWDSASADSVVIAPDAVSWPLRLRGRRPGDRMRLSAGSRKVKKVLLEARIPAEARDRLPILVDADGRVLWIAGVATAAVPAPADTDEEEGGGAGGQADGAARRTTLRITVEPATPERLAEAGRSLETVGGDEAAEAEAAVEPSGDPFDRGAWAASGSPGVDAG